MPRRTYNPRKRRNRPAQPGINTEQLRADLDAMRRWRRPVTTPVTRRQQ